MKTIYAEKFLSKTKIELLDGIHELTVDRYVEYLALAMEDIGVGSTPESAGKHLSSMFNYLGMGKTSEAFEELKNTHNNLYFMINKVNMQSLCFAPFIYTINGKEVFPDFDKKAYTHERVKGILSDLSAKGLKQSHVVHVLDDVKKNLNQILEPRLLVDLEVTGVANSLANY